MSEMGVLPPAPEPVPGTAVGVRPDPAVASWLPAAAAAAGAGGGGIEPPGEQPMGIPVVVRAAISAGS